MSEESTPKGEDGNQSKDGNEGTNEPVKTSMSVELLEEMLQREKQTTSRLLKESQKNKKRAVDAESENDSLKKAKLEEQGAYKEVAETLQKKYDNLKKSALDSQLHLKLVPLASKEGCVDVNALMKLGEKGLLQFDETTGHLEGAEVFLAKAKEEHSYLFKTGGKSQINPLTPGVTTSGTAKPVADMSKAEIIAKLKSLPPS